MRPGFISDLADRLSRSLPGRNAHARMSPLPHRLDELPAEDHTRASVMVLLMGDEQEMYFPLIKRNPVSAHDPHKGQVSLPGGRREESDYNMLFTALRETQEEIGVPASDIKIVGALSELYIPVSNNLVYPYIGWYEGDLDFVLQEFEVFDILRCPVRHLIKEDLYTRRKLKTSYASSIEVPGFELEDAWVWGATAMILEELRELIHTI